MASKPTRIFKTDAPKVSSRIFRNEQQSGPRPWSSVAGPCGNAGTARPGEMLGGRLVQNRQVEYTVVSVVVSTPACCHRAPSQRVRRCSVRARVCPLWLPSPRERGCRHPPRARPCRRKVCCPETNARPRATRADPSRCSVGRLCPDARIPPRCEPAAAPPAFACRPGRLREL